jgi:hypothetical protein
MSGAEPHRDRRRPCPAADLADAVAVHRQDTLNRPDHEAISPTTNSTVSVPATPVTERHVE